MKKLFLVLILFLVGCQGTTLEQELGLDGKSTEEIIFELNNDLKQEVTASITGTELTINSGEETLVYEVGELFYLAVAPYKTFTHTWMIHSVTGCQGELVEEELNVLFINENGVTILNETVSTLKNGFVELWLPRNETGTLTFVQGDLFASTEISTFDESGTCLTTMELK